MEQRGQVSSRRRSSTPSRIQPRSPRESTISEGRTRRLSAAQGTYLLGADYLPDDLRGVITAESAPTTSSVGVTLEVDPDLAERFRSAFTERLAQVGFDPSYELTGEGAVLEELIDVFLGETTS
jgi:hypothetical protein